MVSLLCNIHNQSERMEKSTQKTTDYEKQNVIDDIQRQRDQGSASGLMYFYRDISELQK